MHERVQICQTEFGFIRESPHMNKINHIFRVHGHITILTEETAAKTFDEVGQGSLAWLFPEFSDDSAQQATLSASQSGIGCKRSVDVARPAHLNAVIAARPHGGIDSSTTTSDALGTIWSKSLSRRPEHPWSKVGELQGHSACKRQPRFLEKCGNQEYMSMMARQSLVPRSQKWNKVTLPRKKRRTQKNLPSPMAGEDG